MSVVFGLTSRPLEQPGLPYPVLIGDPACAEVPDDVVDPASAEGATAAFMGWLNTKPRADGGVFVEGWDEIGDAVMAARRVVQRWSSPWAPAG